MTSKVLVTLAQYYIDNLPFLKTEINWSNKVKFLPKYSTKISHSAEHVKPAELHTSSVQCEYVEKVIQGWHLLLSPLQVNS